MSTDRVHSERPLRDDTVSDVPSENNSDDPKPAAWGWFVDFANNSSLHGIKYFGERHRHWSERMFWILSLLISVGGCSVMVHQNYQSWLNDLIIIGFDKDSTHVSSVPFPAVTICSETKVRVEQVNLTDAVDSAYKYLLKGWRNVTDILTGEEQKAMEALAQICEPYLYPHYSFSIDSGLKSDEIVPLLRAIAPNKIFETFFVLWKGKSLMYKSLFYETFTDEGVCFTFNGMTFNEIFKEDMLADDFKSMYEYSETESTANKHENDSSTGLDSNETDYDFEQSNSTDNDSPANFTSEIDIDDIEKFEDDEYIYEMKYGRRKNYAFYKKKLSSDTWSVDSGYKTSASKTYPQRVLGVGKNFGLDLVLKTRKADLEGECRDHMQGFKVMLHNPGEIPRLSQKFFRVPLEKQIDLRVKPIVVTTSKGLAAYSSERRQCYFSDEGDLQFFKIYTQYHCELECLATFTYKKCKCVKYSMPRNKTTKICSRSDMKCYNSIEEEMLELQLNLSDSTRKSLCGCLPSCTFTSYDSDVSETDYKREYYATSTRIHSKLLIYFKENEFSSLKRSELNGTAGFISNCGGLLGLFLGVSMLTFVEIFYYITLRFFCQLKVRKNHK